MKNYLKFEISESKEKTSVYAVKSSQDNIILGEISWFNHWRRYVFFPLENTLFDSSCLSEIKDFIDSLMNKRRGSE